MPTANILGVETRSGFRTLELHEADITDLGYHVDVLIFSAFAGSYAPLPGTVIRSLLERHGLEVRDAAIRPALDMRSALGLWVTRVQSELPFSHILCVELRGSGIELSEVLDNVFAALLMMEVKGHDISTVAMPLLGTGSQKLDPTKLAHALVPRARSYLERSASTKRLVFAEIDTKKAGLVSAAMDSVLGRERITLPQEQLVGALRQDVQHRIHALDSLFAPECEHLRHDWLSLLSQPSVRSVEFGILARKLVELYATRVGAPEGPPLATRIRNMEKRGRVAPWICAYMHVLRQLGNEAAHENTLGSTRVPKIVAPADLTAGLFCVQRLLDSWHDFQTESGALSSPS